jgi:TRAP-type C4-dicarboxylate transport system permease small subunit
MERGMEGMAELGYGVERAHTSGIKALVLSLDKGLFNFEKAMLVLFTAAFISLVFLQWVLRVFSGTGLLWMGEAIQYAMLWMGFFGASVAMFNNQHFKVDIIRVVKSQGLRNTVRVFTSLVGMVLCLLYLAAIVAFIKTIMKYGEGLHYYANIPKWPFYTILVYFFSVSLFRFLIRGFLKNPSTETMEA